MDPYEHKVSPLFSYAFFIIGSSTQLLYCFMSFKIITTNCLIFSLRKYRIYMCFTCKVFIIDYHLNKGWWYKSCLNYNKTLSRTSDNLKCIEHGLPSSTPIPWLDHNTCHFLFFFSLNNFNLHYPLFNVLFLGTH